MGTVERGLRPPRCGAPGPAARRDGARPREPTAAGYARAGAAARGTGRRARLGTAARPLRTGRARLRPPGCASQHKPSGNLAGYPSRAATRVGRGARRARRESRILATRRRGASRGIFTESRKFHAKLVTGHYPYIKLVTTVDSRRVLINFKFEKCILVCILIYQVANIFHA